MRRAPSSSLAHGLSLLRRALQTLAVAALASLAPAQAGEVAATLQPGAAALQAAPADLAALGQRLFREGLGVDGRPVRALRAGGVEAEGAAVACINCHRRSGLGAVEGNNVVPPITGRYLFELDGKAVVQQNIRGVKAFNQRHAPYDDASVAAAIRGGVHVSGRALDELMPRYRIDEASMRALLAYLRPLSAGWSPGVEEQQLQIATVIAPGGDAQQREIFMDTVRAAVRQKNGSVARGARSMASAAEMLLRTERLWQHRFWVLEGAPETWDAQLAAYQARQPVFALVSGLGGAEWGPVHYFCERQALPCWFPSVQAPPPESETDHYTLYFSRGLWLEADVLARHWSEPGAARPQALLQLRGAGLPEALPQTLAAQLEGLPGERLDWPADGAGQAALARRLAAGAARGEAVMLWLAPAELQQLGAALAALPATAASTTPATAATAAGLYVSGALLGDRVPALPSAWLAQVRAIYPYQLPGQREAALSVFHQWLHIARLPLSDERLQSEVYFALTSFNDTVIEMLDNLQRDYLIDRAEAMLTLREKARAEDEAREAAILNINRGPRASAQRPVIERRVATRPLPGRSLRDLPQDTVQSLERAEGTTVYPRLSLAPGQRHASKGAYLVRYPQADPAAAGAPLQAVSGWIVP